MGSETGSFAKSTNTSTPVTQDVTVGFDPKTVILMCSIKTTDNGMEAGHANMTVGFSNGSGEACVASQSEDASAKSDSSNYLSNTKGIVILSQTGTVIAEGDVTMGTGKFTITWTTNDANAYIIKYMAFTQQSEVVNFTSPNSTGNVHYSTTNLPKFLMLISHHSTALDTSAAHGGMSVGFASGPSNEACSTCFSKNNQNTMATKQRNSNVRCGMIEQPNNTPTLGECELTNFVTSPDNGFDLNWTVVHATVNWQFMALAFYEGDWEVGTDNCKISTGTQAYTTTFEPQLVCCLSTHSLADAAFNLDINYGIGATDGTTDVSVAMADENGVADSNTHRGVYSTDCLLIPDEVSTTPDVRARFSAFASTSFTLDFQDVSSNYRFNWFALKTESAAANTKRSFIPAVIG